MTDVKKGNLVINGFGSSNGGVFENVVINGKGNVEGDLDCQLFECNGFATVKGNMRADQIEIKGKGNINGNVHSEKISIDGVASIHGHGQSEVFYVNGRCSLDGHLKGEKAKINGKATINGDCEVEEFQSEGQFTIDGLLNAEEIDIILHGECKAKEIGGQSIKIRPGFSSGLLNIKKGFFSVRLVTDVIEGDEITIENVKAKIVRGNQVEIGPNCEIDLVEYKDSCTINEKAKVKETFQM